MREFRITLISDPTDEYPQNKNNSFKVRLPVRLNLGGNTWQASLWSVSVPDAGHSPVVINTNNDATLLKYRYTFTKRYQTPTYHDWNISFEYKDKAVTLKEVMGSSYPVISGKQLWQNIVTNMEQTMMEDLKTTSYSWKTAKGNAATVSLKSTWKPTFELSENTLVLKKVPREDVFGRDRQLKSQPFSSVGIRVDFAEKFGLLFKDKNNQYQLGPNLDFVLPTTTYTTSTPPVKSNDKYQWLGEHFVSISPSDLLGGNSLFKVKQENGQSYLYLTRFVDWHFRNLNALFISHVGGVKETVMVYCDVVESTIVGAPKHSLLRKVELERKGEGRATTEPLHREWIQVQNQHIESVEVSLATPHGNLLVLPSGKTLITIGFDKYKSGSLCRVNRKTTTSC